MISALTVAAALAWTTVPPVLVRLRRGLRSTSLSGLWRWLALSWMAWGGAGVASLTTAPSGWADLAWYSVAVLMLAPPIAVLGARRPIQRVWPWFVLLPLLLVFLWPVGSALVRSRVPSAWTIESPVIVGYALVLVMGAGNYVGLRHTGSALLWIAGLGLLVGPLCPLTAEWFTSGATGRSWATLLIVLSAWLAVWQTHRPPVTSHSLPLDRVWIEFSNTFGVVWARRVQERFNEGARLQGWPLRLGLEGIQPAAGTSAGKGPATGTSSEEFRSDVDQAAETSLRWLLQKFVDPEWIDAAASRS